jgi:chaperone modulatory protein CbpM
MIFRTVEFLTHTDLDRETLEVWIEEQWLIPGGSAADWEFSEADLARAALIRDLSENLGVNAEGIGIVLNLVDQVHGLRSVLADLVSATRADRST